MSLGLGLTDASINLERISPLRLRRLRLAADLSSWCRWSGTPCNVMSGTIVSSGNENTLTIMVTGASGLPQHTRLLVARPNFKSKLTNP